MQKQQKKLTSSFYPPIRMKLVYPQPAGSDSEQSELTPSH
jgi:hypothetical protein